MKGYKIGDRVVREIGNLEGIIIATDDRKDQFRRVKIKFDGIFGGESWEYENMVDLIINK